MAKLVDALGSDPSGGNTVEVQVLFWVPFKNLNKVNGYHLKLIKFLVFCDYLTKQIFKDYCILPIWSGGYNHYGYFKQFRNSIEILFCLQRQITPRCNILSGRFPTIVDLINRLAFKNQIAITYGH